MTKRDILDVRKKKVGRPPGHGKDTKAVRCTSPSRSVVTSMDFVAATNRLCAPMAVTHVTREGPGQIRIGTSSRDADRYKNSKRIVEKPRVEHVNAVAWLNQSSSADFYLVKVEAFRIGNSDIAPLLTLITGPSPETKIIAEEKERFQARHHERERFWEGLLEIANKKTDLHAGRAASRDSFIGGPSGTAGITFNYVVRQHSGMVELWIGRGPERANENKEIFNKLLAQKEQIERDFGGPLDWQPLEDRKGCRIAVITEIGGYRDPDKWPQVFEWMTDKMVALHRALQSRVEALNL